MKRFNEGEADYQNWLSEYKIDDNTINEITNKYNELYDELFHNPENLSKNKDKWIIFKVDDKYIPNNSSIIVDKMSFTAKDKSYKLYDFEQVTTGNNPIFKVTKKALKDVVGRDGKTIMQPKGTERNINNISVNSLTQLIEKNELVPLRKYDLDTLKQANNMLYIKITRDIKEISHMSTDKGWTSCMRIYQNNKGEFSSKIISSIKKGLLVGYLYKDSLENIDSSKDEFAGAPVARVSINPFQSKDKFLFLKVMVEYGMSNIDFVDATQDYLDDHYNKNTVSLERVFHLDNDFYNDLGDSTLTNSRMDDFVKTGILPSDFKYMESGTDAIDENDNLTYALDELNNYQTIKLLKNHPQYAKSFRLLLNKGIYDHWAIYKISSIISNFPKYIVYYKDIIPVFENNKVADILISQPDLIDYFKDRLKELNNNNYKILLENDFNFFIKYIKPYLNPLSNDFDTLVEKFPDIVNLIKLETTDQTIEALIKLLPYNKNILNKLDKNILANYNSGFNILTAILINPATAKLFNLDYITKHTWNGTINKYGKIINESNFMTKYAPNFNLKILTDKQINEIPLYLLSDLVIYNKNNLSYLDYLIDKISSKNEKQLEDAEIYKLILIAPDRMKELLDSLDHPLYFHYWYKIFKIKALQKYINNLDITKYNVGDFINLCREFPFIVKQYNRFNELTNSIGITKLLISYPELYDEINPDLIDKDSLINLANHHTKFLNLLFKSDMLQDFQIDDWVNLIYRNNTPANNTKIKKEFLKYHTLNDIIHIKYRGDRLMSLVLLTNPEFLPEFTKVSSFKIFDIDELIKLLKKYPNWITLAYDEIEIPLSKIFYRLPNLRPILSDYKKSLKNK